LVSQPPPFSCSITCISLSPWCIRFSSAGKAMLRGSGCRGRAQYTGTTPLDSWDEYVFILVHAERSPTLHIVYNPTLSGDFDHPRSHQTRVGRTPFPLVDQGNIFLPTLLLSGSATLCPQISNSHLAERVKALGTGLCLAGLTRESNVLLLLNDGLGKQILI